MVGMVFNMVTVVQLVRMSDCGSEGRRFDPDQSPYDTGKLR